MYIAVMLLIGASVLDHGMVPSIYPGMARVTDVAEQRQQLADFQSDWTAQALLTLFLQQCDVKDQQTWQLYQVKINELERKYFSLTGQPWPPPVCPKK